MKIIIIESKKKNEKKYNIKLSVEDEQNLDNIDNKQQ